MKIIRSLLTPAFCSLIIFTSCDKALDRPPKDSITDKEMTFTMTEMKLYSNRFYINLPGYVPDGYFEGFLTADNNSDNLIPNNYAYNPQISGTITIPASGGGWSWSNVRAVNYFLANYSVTKEPWTTVKNYVGEMYFWRAWFYFDLMKQFGALPWYSKPLNTEDSLLYAPRLPRNIIADSILADLNKAIDLLNPNGVAEPQRINRDVALAFKSRVALYEGTWEKYHAGTSFGVDGSDYKRYLRQAIDAVEQLIKSDHYRMPIGNDPRWDYWREFNQSDYSNNQDVILWKKFDKALGLSHHTQPILSLEGGNTGISKSLVDAYLCIDGKPRSISPLYHGDDSLLSVVRDRDSRLIQTVFTPGDPREISSGDTTLKFTLPDITKSGVVVNTSGYQIFKGVDPNKEQHTLDSDNGWILFRYAEVLLNYAEAKAELGECTQQVLDETINQLRDRVRMPHLTINVGFTDPDWDFPNLSPLVNEIRRERRVELALEGFRFDDLMRWAAAPLIQRPLYGAKYAQFVGKPFNPPLGNITVSASGYIFRYISTPAVNGWQFDPTKNYLKPLPSNELTLNPNLSQNPGY